MISLFQAKPKSMLGIDIGSSFVKLLGLSQHGNGFRVDSYAIVHLPEGAVIDNNVQDVPVVAEALEKAAKLSGTRIKAAITSVPASVVIVKTLEFSKSFLEDELEEQIKVEADQFIPYPLDEVSIDFQIQGESPTSEELNDVLLVACRQDSVQSREDAVSGAGLICEVIDVDTYALERVCTVLGDIHDLGGRTVGMVDIGASSMTLYVLEEGRVVYSREQAFGGNELTYSLSQASELSVDEIERMKKQDVLPEDLVTNYIEPFRHSVAQQISRALQFYYSSGTHGEIEVLLLMGGVAGIASLSHVVEEELGIRTHAADPFRGMQVDSKINRAKFDADASSLVLTCGLALRSYVA